MNQQIKKYGTYLIVVVAVFVVGIIVGRSTFTPQTIEKKVTEVQTKIEYRTDEKVVADAVEKWKNDHKSWWKEVQYVKVPCPDCAQVKDCKDNTQVIYIERSGGDQNTGEGSKDSSSTSTASTQGTETQKVKEKIEYEMPQWMATANLGIAPHGLTDLRGPFVYGGMLQRRLYRPLWGGVWVQGGGAWAGGVSLSLEW